MIYLQRWGSSLKKPKEHLKKRFGPLIMILVLILISIGISNEVVSSSGHGELDGFDISSRSTETFSLSGEALLDSTTEVSILGENFPGPGGKFGEFIWTGDINDDGFEDLCAASKEAPGQVTEVNENVGYIYIWYGNGSIPSAEFDLERNTPDIIIKGGHEYSYLPGAMEIGHMNDDPYLDIVLGIPVHPSCGRVFIIWGSEQGWPSMIDLHDPGRLAPNGDPYGFERTADHFIVGGHLAPVPWPEANYLTGDDISVNDLDNDGLTDLIFSSPGWNHVVILWGKQSKFDLGNEMTIIQDDFLAGRFGDELEVGDIDGDGWFDMIVSAPFRMDEGTSNYESGSVMVYYNVSRFKGTSEVDALDEAYPVIWGSNSYDRCGYHLTFHDINDDGMEDIFFGAPDADGPANTRSGAGAIYLFKGGNISKFPQTLFSDSGADKIIHGEVEKDGEKPGDRVGSNFDLGDLDGDTEVELVIGIPARYRGELPVGCVVGYETKDVLTSPLKDIDLVNVNERFLLWGSDMMDQAGYSVLLSDITMDGIDDLITGVTGSDGPGNNRKNCGEVFIHQGSNMSIGDVLLGGAPYSNGRIMPGMEGLSISTIIRHNADASQIKNITMLFDPNGLGIALYYENGAFVLDDPFDIFEIDERSTSFDPSSTLGRLQIVLNTSWNVDIGKPWDVVLKVDDGIVIVREFIGLMDFIDDLVLDDHVELLADGNEINNMNDWIRSGTELEFRSFSLKYKGTDHQIQDAEDFNLILFDDGGDIKTERFIGNGTSISVILQGSGQKELGIKAEFDPINEIAAGSPDGPSIKGRVVSRLRLDGTDPMQPENATFISEDGNASAYDNDNEWSVRWDGILNGTDLDPQGSGVKYFKMTIDEIDTGIVRSKGGLHATYYSGSNFETPMLVRIDENVDFSLNDWGRWGPEVSLIPTDNFSVRWHGWFTPSESRFQTFSLSGRGQAKLLIDGETAIDWSDITVIKQSDQIFMNEDEVHEVILYYSNSDLESSVILNYRADDGGTLPISSENLLHPSNSTDILIPDPDDFIVGISSVDWVGKSSEETRIAGVIDSRDPSIDLSSIESWYGSIEPEFTLRAYDPRNGNITGSGIDIGSFDCRIKERNSDSYAPWQSIDPLVIERVEGVEGPEELTVKHSIVLTPNWRGSIQWRISDLVGNDHTTSSIDIGIDQRDPAFTLIDPNIGLVQKEGLVNFIASVTDIGGSGIDGSTLEYRYGTGENWSEWTWINNSGGGQELNFGLDLELAIGENRLQFRSQDVVGNQGTSDIYAILAEERVVNQKPVPNIDNPVNGSVLYAGELIMLDASSSSDDGNGLFIELEYTWISNLEGYLGSGVTVEDVQLFSIGLHRIRVYVDDGSPNHNVSAEVFIDVIQRNDTDDDDDDDDVSTPEGTNYMTLVLLFLLILAIIVIAIVFLIRKNKENDEDQVMLDFVERTEDDFEYESRILEEEKELGIHVENDEVSQDLLDAERRRLYEDEY